jgi:hypothetical protein
MTRLGYTLGAEVLKTMMSIRTHQKRGPSVFFSSLSKNSLYPYIPVEDQPVPLGAISDVIDLPMMALPPLEEAKRILVARRSSLEQAKRDGVPENMLNVYRRFQDWAVKLVRTVESGVKDPTIPLNLQVIRIGDFALSTAAGETLVELGLAVRKASPFEKTVFLGYSNGCIGYVSPADAYPESGWSPWETYSIPDMLFQSYQVPMALSPNCAEMIVKRSLELLERLAVGRAAAPLS